jgi:hypothetical protein
VIGDAIWRLGKRTLKRSKVGVGHMSTTIMKADLDH